MVRSSRRLRPRDSPIQASCQRTDDHEPDSPSYFGTRHVSFCNLVPTYFQTLLTQRSYTNPIAWENLPHHWNLSLIYTIWIFIELCFVYFFYVETRGPTLEELAKIFDGDSAEVAHLDIHAIEKDLHGDDGAGVDEKRIVQTEEKAV
jgi:hypothetical protein